MKLAASPKTKTRKSQLKSEEHRLLNDYLNEIGKVPLLSRDEEKELAKKARRGDEDARQKLVAANLKFVVSFAKSYKSPQHSLLDLVNEGNLGLIKASRRFDERRGVRFISYAIWYIKQAILRTISEQSRAMRVPTNVTERIRMVNKASAKISAKKGREATVEELARKLDLEPADIKRSFEMARTDLSLDAVMGENGEGDPLSSFLESTAYPGPEQSLLSEFLRTDISEVLEHLTPREAKVLKLYYGLDGEHPHTLESIGRIFGLSRERIRQTKEAALTKLRKSPEADSLQSYLN
jgi:RNA polymerase primary sigma factor